MPANSDLTAKYEEERLRAHEQSQIVHLQGQIDELRRMIKDQTNKYNWAMEQTRKTEAAVGQIQGIFDRHSEEIAQLVEISRRDIIGLRKEIAGALVKIEEYVKPIREMQAQILQLGEARKLDRDQIFTRLSQIEDSDQKIRELQAQIKENEDRHRQLASQLDRLRDADAMAVQEARRVGEELQIEKQSLRRQIVETQQVFTELRSGIDDLDARIVRLDEIRQRIDLFAETLPGQIAEQAEKIVDVNGEIKRVERIATERFLMNQERLEDVRRQAEEKLSVLHETDEQHLRQLTAWLERIDSWVRELEQRVNRGINRLEAAQQQHISRIIDLEHRELRTLTALAAAFHDQTEAVKNDHVAALGSDQK